MSERFLINVNTRIITVPPSFLNGGVISDHNAIKIEFEIDKMYLNNDLSTHDIVVQYINAGGEKDIFPVTNKDLSVAGKIIFAWDISNRVTKYSGDVLFSIRFYSSQDNLYTYNYNTEPAKITILDGIVVGIGETSITPDILAMMDVYKDEYESMKNEVQELKDSVTSYMSSSENTTTNNVALSKSWAIGDTGARTGEATNNSKYHSDQSKLYSEAAEASANRAESYAGNTDPKTLSQINGIDTMGLLGTSGVVVDAQELIDEISGRVSSELLSQNEFNTAMSQINTQLDAKASQSDLDTTNTLLLSKLSQNDFNTAMNNVTSQLGEKASQDDLDVVVGSIVLKANQSSVDDINTALTLKANKSEVTNVMTPKGSISYSSLPTTGNTIGWYYYCQDGDGTHGSGNYVWNGSSWYFGGTGDQGYNIVKSNLDIVDSQSGKMYKTYTTTITGGYIEYSDGKFKSYSGTYKCTDFISIIGKDFLVESIFNSNAGITFYDADKQFISGSKVYTYTTPSNACYIRVNNYGDGVGKVIVYINAKMYAKDSAGYKALIPGYVDYSTGSYFLYGTGEYKCTDYIPIYSKIKTTCVPHSGGGIAFFDSNKVYISGLNNYGGDRYLNIPSNAYYLRVTDYDASNNQSGITTCEFVGAGKPVSSNNPLYGKTLSFMGDSLTAVYYKTESESWVSLIGARNGSNVINLGISGNPIAHSSSYTDNGGVAMSERLSTIDHASNYIMLMGGANDFNHNVPIGNDTDSTINTFKGALNYSIEYLITNYPTSKLLFATTYQRDANKLDEPYANAMLDICKSKGVRCVDNYHSSGVHFFNEAWMTIYGAWTYGGDPSTKMTNRHLNALGDEYVSWIFENALKSI